MLTAHFLFSSVVVQRFSEFSLIREQFSNLYLFRKCCQAWNEYNTEDETSEQ